MTPFQGVESEPYSGKWSVVTGLDGFALDRKICASGWHFFFLAGDVNAIFIGAVGAKKIQNAMKRILRTVAQEHFNGLEVTGIIAKRFLRVPYTIVSAHSRHEIQRAPQDQTLSASCENSPVRVPRGGLNRYRVASPWVSHETGGSCLIKLASPAIAWLWPQDKQLAPSSRISVSFDISFSRTATEARTTGPSHLSQG